MKFSLRQLICAFTLLTSVSWLMPVQAMPAFMRQTGKSCSYCHNAWPQLTAKGRQFKELGYRLPSQVDKNISLSDMLETFPIGGSLVARPFDKKDTGDTKLRALHELELFVAGPIGKKFSGWVEIEGEDEDGFNSQIGNGNVTYHFNRALNLTAAYASIFWSDPYSFLGGHFNMTGPIRPVVIDNSFGGGEGGNGALRKQRQMLSAYGRVFNNRVFYNLVYAGSAKDVEGPDPRVVMGRLAFDITDDIHLGGFYMDGSAGSDFIATSPDFQRFGIDGHIDFQNITLQGAYVHSEDDLNNGVGKQKNDLFSIQSFYTFKDQSGNPSWVPLIRYDDYETSNGTNSFGAATFQLNYYITANSKIFGQYYTELNTPAGDPKNDRFTIQLQIAF